MKRRRGDRAWTHFCSDLGVSRCLSIFLGGRKAGPSEHFFLLRNENVMQVPLPGCQLGGPLVLLGAFVVIFWCPLSLFWASMCSTMNPKQMGTGRGPPSIYFCAEVSVLWCLSRSPWCHLGGPRCQLGRSLVSLGACVVAFGRPPAPLFGP